MTSPGSAQPEPQAAAEHPAHLAHHFATAQQQFEAGKLGMWIFLLTEILLFGGLFCAYAVYRANHPEIFFYAEQFLDRRLGALNTGILITSSLTMAWAVRCAQCSQQRGLVLCLALTLTLACGFLGVKYVEYKHKWQDGLLWAGQYKPDPQILPEGEGRRPSAELLSPLEQRARKNAGLFFSIYFMMTGLHGIHVLAGMGAMTWLLVRAAKGAFGSRYFAPVDYVGLYWHLVDMIWIYLFPLLYLIH
jgi:cytochrome c oxidase subunit 3